MPEVSGFNPDTGEEVTIRFQGNFPIKDPDTGKFVFEDSKDDKGKKMRGPKFPGRDRVRYEMLDANGEEVLDTRPMAAAVMFSDHIPPEQKIAQMMKDANFRAQLRAYLAEEQGIDTFDDFDYDDDLLPIGVDGFISPHEIVHDPAIERNVPRFLQGTFRAVKKAVQKGTGPLATPPAPSAASLPEDPSEAKQTAGEGDSGGA